MCMLNMSSGMSYGPKGIFKLACGPNDNGSCNQNQPKQVRDELVDVLFARAWHATEYNQWIACTVSEPMPTSKTR